MANKRRWTKEEDKILVQAIKANPHNLTQCFREVGERLNRTNKSVKLHWYTTLANPEHKKYTGTAFLTIDKKSYNPIRKNAYTAIGRATTVKTSKKLRLWAKVKKLLGL